MHKNCFAVIFLTLTKEKHTYLFSKIRMGFNFKVRHTWLISRQRARAFHPLQNPPILQNRPAGKAFYEIFKFGSTTTNLLTFSFGTLPLSSSSWVLCSKLLIISDETIIYFLFFLLGYTIYRVS